LLKDLDNKKYIIILIYFYLCQEYLVFKVVWRRDLILINAETSLKIFFYKKKKIERNRDGWMEDNLTHPIQPCLKKYLTFILYDGWIFYYYYYYFYFYQRPLMHSYKCMLDWRNILIWYLANLRFKLI
jgi:hypothetical protein